MRRFRCNSDVGSVLIGNKDWTILISNHVGDGTTYVRVYDNENEFRQDPMSGNMHYAQAVYGKFNLYRNDVDMYDVLSGKIPDKKAVYRFNGHYHVYSAPMHVFFVKIGDIPNNYVSTF